MTIVAALGAVSLAAAGYAAQTAAGGIWTAGGQSKSDGTVTVCEDEVTGRISPQNGVCGAPEKPGTPNFAAWKAAEFPFSRTHDLNLIHGYGAPYVIDVPWIFRDFDADENDPKSYDFACTDDLLRRIREVGTEPFYRLGGAYESQLVKKYNIFPPKDFAKWARVCEHIIAHYNEGWADGFKWNVRYWEIWNEPNLRTAENNGADGTFWRGPRDQFKELWKTALVHLKARFPELKFGGAAFAGTGGEWGASMVKEFAAEKVPLDFYSWHGYATDPKKYGNSARWVRKMLDTNGYTNTLSIIDEWNYVCAWDPWARSYSMGRVERGDLNFKCAAFIAASMIELDAAGVDVGMFYDARSRGMNALFDPQSLAPMRGYYPFVAWRNLRRLGERVKTDVTFTNGVWSVAAKNAEGKLGVLIVNYTNDDNLYTPKRVTLRLKSGASLAKAVCHLTDRDYVYTQYDPEPNPDGSIDLVLMPNAFVYVEVPASEGTRNRETAFTDAAEKIEIAHRRLMDEFLSPQGLILDYLGDLPTPEECRECRPNAMGWWCPIENGVMFTAPYLQAAIRRAETKRGTAEFARAKAEIEKMADGLLLAASVSDVPGFIARGFATDGRSHHPLGSTCQSSAWFVGMHAYAKWSGADSARRARVVAKMKEVAAALEAGGWSVPADQRFRGQSRGNFVSEGELQFRAATHWLYTLLVMWDVTGDPHWWDEYAKARDSKIIPLNGKENRFSKLTRLEICEQGWAADGSWAARADGQLMWIYVGAQESLAGMIALEPDPAIKARYRKGLAANAVRARAALAKAANYDNRRERPFKYANWRTGYRWEVQNDLKTAEKVANSGNGTILGKRKDHERGFMTHPCSAMAVCGYAGMFREDVAKAICCYDFREINLCEFFFAVCGWYADMLAEDRKPEVWPQSASAYSVESGPCGDLYVPTGAGRKTPKILAIHGGGWSAQDRASFRGVAEALAKRGAIVYNVDYRLTTEAPWPACGDDCLAAAAYLSAWRTNEFTDAIFTIGGSAGGHLSLMTGLRFNRRKVAGVISISGIADAGPDRAAHPDRYDLLLRGLDGAAVERAFPTAYVSSDLPDVLLTHYYFDKVVPVESAKNFESKLRDAGAYVETYYYDFGRKDEGHAIWVKGSDPHRLYPDIEERVWRFISERFVTDALECVGTVRIKSSREISGASTASVGFEGLDRHLFDPGPCYDKLSEAGVKRASRRAGAFASRRRVSTTSRNSMATTTQPHPAEHGLLDFRRGYVRKASHRAFSVYNATLAEARFVASRSIGDVFVDEYEKDGHRLVAYYCAGDLTANRPAAAWPEGETVLPPGGRITDLLTGRIYTRPKVLLRRDYPMLLTADRVDLQ